MKNKTLVTSLIFIAIIFLVIIFSTIYKLNFNLLYTQHKQIDISIGKEFDNKDILNIVKEVTGNKKIDIQKLEVYEDMVSISVKEISDEELESLNTKLNEKYEIDNKVEDIKVTDIPKVKFFDYIKTYIKPLIITCILLVIYFGLNILIEKKRNR